MRIAPILNITQENKYPKLSNMLIEGKNIAIISDAGTPGISDPGYKLVRASIAKNIKIIPVPGASAVMAGLVASGLPTDRFLFGGISSA